jgi:hypothetical protein
VAVKLLDERFTADLELQQRFTREALAAARLSGGPNTVTIFDVGRWRGRPYIVMEYLPGGSLEQRLRADGPPSRELALRWLAEAAAALDHAHAHGIVHRDIKPANLLLDGDDVLHVADFGIASAAGLAALTQTGTVLGTAGYLAPEQADGSQVTAAADRYTLTVVAFELLTGQRPFQRDSPTADAAAQLNAPIPSVSQSDQKLPAELDAVFARGLARDPQRRYPTCAGLVEACAGVLGRATAPTRVGAGAPTRIRPWLADDRRRPRRLPTALVGLLVAASAAAGATIAAAVAHGHDVRLPVTNIQTVTAPTPPAQTVTVTAAAPTPPVQTVTVTTAVRTPAASGASLAQRAEALIAAGAFETALPLLQQAVGLLQGDGTTAEGTADYELAYTITQLGSCDGVVPLLDRAKSVLGGQSRIDELRAVCTGPPGHRPGHGNGRGNGNG